MDKCKRSFEKQCLMLCEQIHLLSPRWQCLLPTTSSKNSLF